MTHHKRRQNGARRFDALDHIERRRNGDGRNSSFFDDALNQCAALVANRSGGRKQNHLRLFGFHRVGDCFGKRFLHSS